MSVLGRQRNDSAGTASRIEPNLASRREKAISASGTPVRRHLEQPRIGQCGARLRVPGDQPCGRRAGHDHARDRPLRAQPGVH